MKNQYKLREFKCLGCGKIVKLRRPKNKTKYCSVECYRKSKHPQRKNGKVIKCEWCGKEIYKPKSSIKKHKHHFCSLECANKWQRRNKIKFICKVCGKTFRLSKSVVNQVGRNPTYCSIDCREKDPEYMGHINGNLAQQNKKGLNKLELAGREILKGIGLKKNQDFQEQVLMFNKFLVDVVIPNKKIIIQWDGDYWHSKPKRKNLDKSQDTYFKKSGYEVIRIKESEIKKNKKEVYDYLKRAIQ